MIANANWLDALAEALDRHPRAVLVTLVEARGSTPRGAGAAMVVSPDAVAAEILALRERAARSERSASAAAAGTRAPLRRG